MEAVTIFTVPASKAIVDKALASACSELHWSCDSILTEEDGDNLTKITIIEDQKERFMFVFGLHYGRLTK